MGLAVGLRLLSNDLFVVVRPGARRRRRHQQERLPGAEGIRLDEVGRDGLGHGLLALRGLRELPPPRAVREFEVTGRVRAAGKKGPTSGHMVAGRGQR